MADDLRFGDFTGGEKLRIAVLTARAAKRGLAGDGVDISDLTRRIERIEKQAAARRKKK
ncbi:DUF6257 family protein [Streptomyces sp. ND04-05B]|uniref:DUF6257 family protein n=1 Tax=Streptomyces sp. ND04-05B TaxID=3028693 RepID=UPI0029AEF817|nr:DUF6257 family protein [Streptomyces sp. ND04-05B]MDX3068809.1 DUF6257 family protein [Streptomyces sp. ND04-05B]